MFAPHIHDIGNNYCAILVKLVISRLNLELVIPFLYIYERISNLGDRISS